MTRKTKTPTSVWVYLWRAVLVLLVLALLIGCAMLLESMVLMGSSIFLTFAVVFWALIAHLGFSFGKSRYPTRTERKRMRHRKKNKGDEKVLGRDIRDRRDL
ncbi:MAG: hypothetical protein HN350_19965 [Phycisphaerales bacterium]|jgi:hypothetical protein|nr:hypothetical protein [Phycisphaerales bacterium]